MGLEQTLRPVPRLRIAPAFGVPRWPMDVAHQWRLLRVFSMTSADSAVARAFRAVGVSRTNVAEGST